MWVVFFMCVLSRIGILLDISTPQNRDANTLLASIHTYVPTAPCDPITFQPCSDRALSNLLIYVDSFRGLYDINEGLARDVGVGTGRYVEDVYFGGNVRPSFPHCAADVMQNQNADESDSNGI
jgi:hypothetical protein